MNAFRTALALGVVLGVSALPVFGSANKNVYGERHAVFVMTNDADRNEIIAYERLPNGTLRDARKFSTGGRGSGGLVDPLGSQGSLLLSDDGDYLFAANAGSGTISVFRVLGDRLQLTDQVPSGGSEPNAIAQHGRLLYVLNTAGSSSVVGFQLHEGKLTRIRNSQRYLSANFVNSASIDFSDDGRLLAVTERATNSIDIFRVQRDGRLSDITVNPAVASGTFAAVFAPNGALLVPRRVQANPIAPRFLRTRCAPTASSRRSAPPLRRSVRRIAGTSSRRMDALYMHPTQARLRSPGSELQAMARSRRCRAPSLASIHRARPISTSRSARTAITCTR